KPVTRQRNGTNALVHLGGGSSVGCGNGTVGSGLVMSIGATGSAPFACHARFRCSVRRLRVRAAFALAARPLRVFAVFKAAARRLRGRAALLRDVLLLAMRCPSQQGLPVASNKYRNQRRARMPWCA